MPTDRFINPYTFIPLADGSVDRKPPPGHHQLARDRHSGIIEFTVSARSQLLIGGFGAAEVPRRRVDGQSVPFIPGSSWHGAIRSVHEALAGGCLRVLSQNGQFRPGYREPARSRPDDADWRLAVVGECDEDGRPLRFQLTDRVVWAEFGALEQALGGASQVRSGARVDLDESAIQTQNFPGGVSRYEIATGVTRGDGWVLLITDAGTRGMHDYHAVAGRLTDELAGGVTDVGWEAFRAAAFGSRDWQEATRGTPPTPSDLAGLEPDELQVLVRQPARHRAIGYRDRAYPFLRPGQVVWVRPEQGPDTGGASTAPVTSIRLAWFWRRSGGSAVVHRIPPGESGHAPCTDPASLCLSCRIFGSADPQGEREDRRNRSYRGHVRVFDLLPDGANSVRVSAPFRRAPLGSPKPGAGQFYLVNPTNPRSSENRPLREWGGETDSGTPRRIRGRKFYWQSSDSRPWHAAQPGDSAQFTPEVRTFEAGSRFRGRVAFDNLDDVALGSLIAALQPGRLFLQTVSRGADVPIESWGVPVGGAKPLGFGAATVSDLRVTRWTAEQRYGGQPPGASGGEACNQLVMAWVHSALARRRDHGGGQLPWEPASVVLRVDSQPGNRIAYPPGAAFPADYQPLPAGFRPSFAFWRRSTGERVGGGRKDLIPLPEPKFMPGTQDAADQSLPIIED